MAGNDAFFVGGDDPHSPCAGSTGYALGVALVRRVIDAQPKERREMLQHLGTQRSILFTDTGGEYQRVQPPQARGEPPDFLGDSVGIEVDGQGCAWVVAGAQFAHVAANPGYAEQAGLPIQQRLQIANLHTLIQQVQQHTGIQGAAAAAHGEAVEGAETRGHLDAAAGLDGAQEPLPRWAMTSLPEASSGALSIRRWLTYSNDKPWKP